VAAEDERQAIEIQKPLEETDQSAMALESEKVERKRALRDSSEDSYNLSSDFFSQDEVGQVGDEVGSRLTAWDSMTSCEFEGEVPGMRKYAPEVEYEYYSSYSDPGELPAKPAVHKETQYDYYTD
jgi:hypothetical protein